MTTPGSNATTTVNATTPPITTPVNATLPPLTTPGNNATVNGTTPPITTLENNATVNVTTTPMTTPVNATIPLLTTTENNATVNATTPPMTTPGNNATVNATTPPITTPVNATLAPLTTPGNNATVNATTSPMSTTANATIPPITTPVNATIPPLTTPGNNATVNASTPPITTPVNATLPPLTTPGNNATVNATTPPITTPRNTTTENATQPSQSTPGNATTPPITNSTTGPTVSTTNPINTTTTPATCPAVPCPPLSVCVNSICQCVTGTIPLNNACVETKTFTSSLRVNRTFVDAMNDPKSREFQETAKEIIAAVNEALRNQPNYINSTVIKLMSGSIVASVNSFYEPNSPVTQESVINAMNTAIRDCEAANCGILANAQYTATNLCDQVPSPCDGDTTMCEAKDGTPVCTCKSGHVSSQYQARSCRVCPSGYKAQENKCVQCPFGYSGFNCDDSSLLALVVVSCVLGGILLIVILAVLIYICVTRGKKSSNSNYYSTPYPAEEFRTPQNSSQIPRVTLTSNSSPAATGNSLEMAEGPGRKGHSNGLSGSYDLRTDGMRTFKDINPTRYSYLMGHENPYFVQGDEKR
uniref:Si:ch211-198m17.1 n=1 Tax=Cyprinus carpio TaxID=7962 RepID=A0A8C2DY07_CYPCA